jgi:hypothetical protein
MKLTFLMTFVVFALFQSGNCNRNAIETKVSPTPKVETKYDRLPANITLETEVVKTIQNENGKTVSRETTTVEKRLNELKARYEKDKLVDEKGREIRFFEPLCRGVSAGEEQDDVDRKAKEKELAELEKKYTVIVLLCDPRKAM